MPIEETHSGKEFEVFIKILTRGSKISACKTLFFGSETKRGRGSKAILCGSLRTTSSVGIIVSERFGHTTGSGERFNGHIMKVVIAAIQRRDHLLSAYASQIGCSERGEDGFGACLMR